MGNRHGNVLHFSMSIPKIKIVVNLNNSSHNPLNLVNWDNFNVPFAPLDGRSSRRIGAW